MSSLVAFILKTLKNEEIVEAGEREVSRANAGEKANALRAPLREDHQAQRDKKAS